ncbi:hypothetical protein L249_3238 [Ophiocordyceps polyrhachis-furcata BCC 54312]|uniref:Protein kinase domain-containing protein n=1 Tax=Ophiocordyceps polyrhachis-furcata BCC 54312 TaxID=1330021 RepID=A0A367LSF0_9HYPO|nr:hypothetical protein L249_3238 [Ophiocordyceps polyrhachis-furcata BCC 54312]
MEGLNDMEELRKRIRELEQGRQEAERRADEQQQGRQEAERRADEQQQGRQEAERRAAEQQQGRQEVERRADRRVEAAERRAAEVEEQTRSTTFDEYIAACHHGVFSRMEVERDARLRSKGTITNPRNKLCPDFIKPWSLFLNLQKNVFDTLYGHLSVDSRAFESKHFLAALGNRVATRPIADEKGLEYFLHNSVEDPVRNLVSSLRRVDNLHHEFNMGNGIVFENHPHNISDVSDEVVEREQPTTPPQASQQALPPTANQLRPDQICIYRTGNEGAELRTMVYVCEYKAPHKLTAPHLRAGLREMDIYKEVVNRATIPKSIDPDGCFRYHAERLTASALTQTYHYMIEAGLGYGLLTTGEAIVFLHVNWTEPGTLYYHLAEPAFEVAAHKEHVQSSSAVGQLLAFTLMALGQPGEQMIRRQDQRDAAKAKLNSWMEDFEMILQAMSPDERKPPADSESNYAPKTYRNFDRTPAMKRKKRLFKCGKMSVGSSEDETSDEDGPPHTPSPDVRRPRGGATANAPRRSQRLLLAQKSREEGEQEVEESFCTQACLLGLVRGGALDRRCPNVASHCGSEAYSRKHRVSHAKWLQLLTEQMRRTLDGGIEKLGKGGARGVLFKVTLLAYGYTFVCKGTVNAFVPDLEHEAAVYKRLEPVQGVHVPVFLGAVDLRKVGRTYYYDHRVYVIHMTCLSWGGNTVTGVGLGDPCLQDKALASLRAVHRWGVLHKDVRSPNIVVNDAADGVMFIDFERAVLLYNSSRKKKKKKKKIESANGEDDGSEARRDEYRKFMMHGDQEPLGRQEQACTTSPSSVDDSPFSAVYSSASLTTKQESFTYNKSQSRDSIVFAPPPPIRKTTKERKN